jgi:arylsulfatase A-like enzyme
MNPTLRPHILLIIVDCMRADVVSHPRPSWPFLTRLAQDSAVFDSTYTTCPTTTPAVTSMLTGHYPPAHGVTSLRSARLPASVPSLAESLGASGYYCVGSFTGPLLRSVGLDRGFHTYEYRPPASRSIHSSWGESARALVHNAQASEASFVVLHIWDLHADRTYPTDYERPHFGRNTYERAVAALDRWLERLLREVSEDTIVALTGDHGENLSWEPRTRRQQWLAQRIANRVDVDRLAVRTVRFGLRHGRPTRLRFAPRFLWNHSETLDEELVRVPLIWRGPSVTPGTRSGVVSHVDIAATVADLAGVTSFGSAQGVSLSALLRDPSAPDPARRLPVFMQTASGHVPLRGVRSGQFKLVYAPSEPWLADQLYDLDQDPRESRNLALTHTDVVGRLRSGGDSVLGGSRDADPLSSAEEAELEARLRELGYL